MACRIVEREKSVTKAIPGARCGRYPYSFFFFGSQGSQPTYRWIGICEKLFKAKKRLGGMKGRKK
jgi:hypothetical protein